MTAGLARELSASLLLFVAMAGLYSVTRHPFYAWDGLWDALQLREGAARWPWSAAHPLADLLGRRVVLGLDAAAAPLEAMARVNAVSGALAVVWVRSALVAAGARAGLAWGAALSLGLSGGAWFLAGGVESYGPGLAGAAWMGGVVALEAARPGRLRGLGAGVSLGLAALLHLLNLGWGLALLMLWRRAARPAWELGLAAAGAAAVVGWGCARFQAALSLPAGVSGWLSWLRISLGSGREAFWMPDPWELLGRLPSLLVGGLDPLGEVIPLTITGSGAIAGGVLWGLLGVRAWAAGGHPARGPVAGVAALQALALALADARNEFSVALLVPLWLWVGLELSDLPWGRSGSWLLALAGLLGLVNLLTAALPRLEPGANPHLGRAQRVASALQASDQLLAARGLGGLTLRWVAPCPVHLFEEGPLPPHEAEALRPWLFRAMRQGQAGGAVFLEGELMSRIAREPGRRGPWRAALQGLMARPVESIDRGLLYELAPAP